MVMKPVRCLGQFEGQLLLRAEGTNYSSAKRLVFYNHDPL
jgi:hypothetical protein